MKLKMSKQHIQSNTPYNIQMPAIRVLAMSANLTTQTAGTFGAKLCKSTTIKFNYILLLAK